MRKICLILLVFALAGCFTRCSEEPDPAVSNFEIKRNYFFEISQISSPIFIPGLYEPTISMEGDQKFSENNTSLESSLAIGLKSVKLIIEEPSDRTFKFLKNFRIYINAKGLDEKLIAERQNVPDDVGDNLSLAIMQTNLTQYIKKDQFEMRYELEADEQTSSKTEVKSKITFDVTAMRQDQ